MLRDEPTNDLDIPTLEVLEESPMEYRGALVVVTHDRFMLDRVSTVVVGLDGLGAAERFADYSQWESWQRQQMALAASKSAEGNQRPRSAGDEAPRATAKKSSPMSKLGNSLPSKTASMNRNRTFNPGMPRSTILPPPAINSPSRPLP